MDLLLSKSCPIVFNHIKSTHLWSNLKQHRNKIVYHGQYNIIDDTLVLINGNERQINLLNT